MADFLPIGLSRNGAGEVSGLREITSGDTIPASYLAVSDISYDSLTVTTLYASTVSATEYRNIRPYVCAVDSATTTSLNINGGFDTFLVNTTTTSVTLYLPDASAYADRKITVSKIDDGGSYRSVTLSGATLQTATNTVRLYDPTESVTVIAAGNNWYSLDYDRAYGVVVVAKNDTGSTLAKGTPVRVTGATGDNVLIGAVSAANNHVPEAPNGDLSRCIGVVEHDIPNNEFGHVLTKGTLYKFNTNAYNEGDILYLASSGGFTNVKLPAPYDEVFLGIVTRQSVNNGSILIDVANPIHINDIVGFNLASGLTNGDLISYSTTTSTFTNVQAVNVSGQGKFGSLSGTTLTVDGGVVKNSFDIASGIYSAPADSRLYVQGKSYFQSLVTLSNNLTVSGAITAGNIYDTATDSGIPRAKSSGKIDYSWLEEASIDDFANAVTTNYTSWYAAGLMTGVTLGTFTMTANRLYAMPFVSPRRGATIDDIEIYVTTGAASTSAIMGLYTNSAENDLYPDELVAQGAVELDTTTNAQKRTWNIAYTLIPGQLYWLAVVANGAPVIRGISTNQTHYILGTASSANTTWTTHLYATHTYDSSLPSTFPKAGTTAGTGAAPGLFYDFSS
jgi:hypothetical protein